MSTMNIQAAMEDRFPGCSTGRRLGLMRSIKRSLLDRMTRKLKETNRNDSQYNDSIASDHHKFHLIKRQLEEMEANRIQTCFAVTDNELAEAISAGAYTPQSQPVAAGNEDWKVDGF